MDVSEFMRESIGQNHRNYVKYSIFMKKEKEEEEEADILTVSCKVIAGESTEIGVFKPFVISVYRSHDGGPRSLDCLIK